MAEKIINNIKLPNGEVCKIGGSSGFEPFDTILKDHILTFEESKGWALQGTYVYKEAVAGTRYGYPDFYNKCVEEFENSSNSQAYLKSNVTKVGSLVDKQGVLSGFSSSNYAYIPNGKQNNNAEYVIKFTTGSTITTSQVIFHSEYFVNIEINSAGNIYSYSWEDNSTNIIINSTTPNTTYWIKIVINGNTKTFSYSTNGVTYTEAVSFVDSGMDISAGYQLCFGINTNVYVNPFLGTIDLNECYINVNGQRFWSGTDTITKNPNGHLFYDISEKDKIDELYNTYGIAWYYGIDKENERIFLPRTKWFIQPTGEITEVNTVNEAGLPNITGNFMAYGYRSGNTGGAFSSSVQTANQLTLGPGEGAFVGFMLNASRSSSVYGNSDTVQPPSINQLLYICVGNTNVESAVTDVVDVTTTENDTMPLFTGMYFDFTPNNVSWLKAGQQANSGGIYKFTYNELVNILNGETKYGDLKVINVADMEVGVDYSEYWKVNQEDMTFITPTAISNKALSGGVMGNGNALGLTAGTGTTEWNGDLGNSVVNLQARGGDWSQDQSIYTKASINSNTFGITTDPTKSGIIAEQSTSQLYFKVANAVQNLELLDAGEVLEAVNNVVPNNKGLIASYGAPDYSAGITIVLTTAYPYIAPCDGFVFFNTVNNGDPTVYVNGSTALTRGSFTEGGYSLTGFIRVGKDDVLTTNDATNYARYFFPLKGVIK